jgi:SAM-dependent methyltransferase
LARLLNFYGPDKFFFHFFQSFFERLLGPICPVESPFNGMRQGLASFFFTFFESFFSRLEPRITRISSPTGTSAAWFMPAQKMRLLRSQRSLRFVLALIVGVAGVWLFAYFRAKQTHTGHRPVVSFATVKPVLEALANELPPQLKGPNEDKWKTWAQHEDDIVRARLERGALDSMINLLLFGTSFTTQPRVITMNDSDDAVVQLRLDDLLQGLRTPGKNERLIFLRNVLRRSGMDPDSSAGYAKTKTFVLENLRRVVQEQTTFQEQFDEATRESKQEAGLSKRSHMFRDRGISLDTTILSSFGIEGALRDIKDKGALPKKSIARVAVIGPGLDFTDKGFGYDFYPLQTLQPFAVYDSLIRLELAEPGKIEITAFDISREVLEHLRRAHDRAKTGENYVVQLPRESWPWVADAIQYWRSFGTEIGRPVVPIQPPPALKGLETRAVEIRPEVILSCKPVDLNVVFEQFDRSTTRRFDLIIATNVFLYYDTVEQALALQNISTVLKPAGFLLTNDWLPQLPQIPMRSMGYTPVRYGESGEWGDNVFWWQRQ